MPFSYLYLILTFLRGTAELSILPVLPLLAVAFDASRQSIELVIPVFLAGIFFTKILLVLGVSERHGYKKTLLAFQLVTLIGITLCLVPKVLFLYVGRFLTGVGAGCLSTILVSQLKLETQSNFDKNFPKLTKYTSFYGVISTLIGTTLATMLHWSLIFIFIFVIAILCYVFLIKTNFSKPPMMDKISFKKAMQLLYAKHHC